MPIAYSYKRFSSEAQEGGDSIRRQTAIAERYLVEHPELELVLDRTLNMSDEGVSAFKGEHIRKGALSKFFDHVYQGSVKPGSYLLIESLDRFSRQAPHVAATDLLNLIRYGIIVVTLSDQVTYSDETLKDTQGVVVLMGALIAMSGHHREQVEKGRRITAAWSNKYEKIKDGHILSVLTPFWLKVNEDRTAFVVLEDKVEIVREVFLRKANGEGKAAISNSFNLRGLPTPKGRSRTWHPSAIDKILSSDAVIGRFTNSRGDSFESYYPVVIDSPIFQAVQALRQTKGTRGAAVGTYHPLSGQVKHESCGSIMRRINKGSGYVRFMCVSCNLGLKYQVAEAAVCDALYSLQYVAMPSTEGERANEIEWGTGDLSNDIESAYEAWRQTKKLADKTIYERLLDEQTKLNSELKLLKGRNTMALAEMEHFQLSKFDLASDRIGALRSVAISTMFNHDCSTVTLVSISGKTISVPANADDVANNTPL